MLQQALHVALQDAQSRNQLAVRTHEDNTLAYRELASKLHFSLDSLVETDMTKLSQTIGGFDASLVRSESSYSKSTTPNIYRNGS
jgi:hypothetical protein